MRSVTYSMSSRSMATSSGSMALRLGDARRRGLSLLDRRDPRGRRPPDGTAPVRDDAVLGDRRPGSIARRRRARVGRALEAVAQGRVLQHAVGGPGQCPPGSGGLAEEIERWRAEPGDGEIAIGGATLAVEAAALGLIDEYRRHGLPGACGRWHSVLRRGTSAGWISNSSRPAPSARGRLPPLPRARTTTCPPIASCMQTHV